jgi:hypothetical protein
MIIIKLRDRTSDAPSLAILVMCRGMAAERCNLLQATGYRRKKKKKQINTVDAINCNK